MASSTHVQYVYNRYGEKADVCVAEGMMGLYDGYYQMKGSCAEIAGLLNIPVVLVVNARAAAYSVAPVLYGFKHFRSSVRIAGVVFSQVSSSSHFACLKEACSDAGLECLGYLPYSEDLRVPSRHLGLTLTVRQSMDELAEKAAALVEQYIDVDKLLNLCTRIFPCRYTLPYTSELGVEAMETGRRKKMRIAVARDPAFNFIYRENLDRLAESGNLTFFSPVYGSDLPDADLVYLPGGYPELFARQLHRRKRMMQQLRDYAESGGKVFAECGGMMFLTRSLTARKGGTAYQMTGLLPVDCTMENARLHLGYRRMDYQGVSLRGHEFHYSSIAEPDTLPSVTPLYNVKGTEVSTPLYRYKNVIAGYTIGIGEKPICGNSGLNQLKLMQNQKLHPVMLAGTGSDVGKSVLAAALCRIFMQDGYHPAPFKAQNMALNSYATPQGWRSDALRPFRLKPQAYLATQI